jgi:V-type H+-transporting ATPase subunit C
MSNTKYILVSLPKPSSAPTSEEALKALQKTISPDVGTLNEFHVPEFKIGTLDALVQQADDLGKLSGACEGVVSKVGDALKGLLGADEDKLSEQKVVNDS